jgi:hypothetical protein
VHEVSGKLATDGQLLPPSSPADILSTLCAHHLLERFEYPEPGYRFAHQLFEEYYAFRAVELCFEEAMTDDHNVRDRAKFVRDFLNEPAWTEPVKMLAECLKDAELIAGPTANRASANALVEMALAVDPIFAAHLGSILKLRSSDPIARGLESRLRNWYASTNDHHRQCALAGMLASGMDSFRDIIEPLLSGDDEQARLRTLRLWRGMHPSVFGTDWQSVLSGWSEAARATFVSEILHAGFAPETLAFALADNSLRVKAAAIDSLNWIGAEDEFLRASNDLDDSAFLGIIAHASYDTIPAELRARAVRLLR